MARRSRPLAVAVVVVIAAAGATACATTAPNGASAAAGTVDGPCTPGEMAAAIAALQATEADVTARLTITAIAESCPVPAGILATLQAIGSGDVSPADAATIAAAGLAEEKSLIAAACAVPGTYEAVAAVHPSDRARILYEGCEYERLGVVTPAEAEAAALSTTTAAAGAIVAHPLYVWLTKNGMAPATARTLARLTMGLKAG